MADQGVGEAYYEDRTAALRYYKLAQNKSKPEKYLKEISDLESRGK